MTRVWFCLALCLATLVAAQAETIPLVSEKEPVAIPLGKTREFQFGTVPQANTTVLLKIRSRMDFPGLGGSMQFMRLILNGREVQAAVGRSAQRLLNRPFRAPVAQGLEEAWYDAGAEGHERGWKVIYAPDETWEPLDKCHPTPSPERSGPRGRAGRAPTANPGTRPGATSLQAGASKVTLAASMKAMTWTQLQEGMSNEQHGLIFGSLAEHRQLFRNDALGW